MKKVTLSIAMLLLIIAISSCTPEAVVYQKQPLSCCGDEGNIPPPPFDAGN